MVCSVGNILYGGTDEFKADVINRLVLYLGMEINQNNDKSITIYQQLCQSYPTYLVDDKPTHRKGCKNTTREHFSNLIIS